LCSLSLSLSRYHATASNREQRHHNYNKHLAISTLHQPIHQPNQSTNCSNLLDERSDDDDDDQQEGDSADEFDDGDDDDDDDDSRFQDLSDLLDDDDSQPKASSKPAAKRRRIGSDDDDDDDDDDEHQLLDSSDEDEFDDKHRKQLLDALQLLETTRGPRRREINEGLVENEFGVQVAGSSGDQININDLLQSLEDTTHYGALRKQLKRVSTSRQRMSL
jgi:hypothetical protein